MKKTIYFISFFLLFYSCKKDNYGIMKYKAKFCTTNIKSLNRKGLKKESNDTTYTIFGDYITSITPNHLSSNIGMFIFQDNYNQGDPSCHMIAFVENTTMYADFSNNAEIEFLPTLHSTDIKNNLFTQKETNFRFITFTSSVFNQEFEIPIQYLSVIKNNSNFFLQGSIFDYQTDTNKIKVNSSNHSLYYHAIHGNLNGMPTGFDFVFGQTDTSFIYIYNGINLAEEERFPFWDQQNRVIIRSNKFSAQKIVMPDDGETNTMYATLSFDTENLIQIYAGNDNIAYTSDDIFVYAPRFWDRVNIDLELK